MDCPKRCDTDAVPRIPDDPLVEILSRVPAKSLCRFKCVSKAWRDLIADPHYRKKLPQALEGFFFMVKKHYCHGESGCDEPCGHEDGDDSNGDDCEDGDDSDGEDCEDGDDSNGEDCKDGDDSDGEEVPRYGYGFICETCGYEHGDDSDGEECEDGDDSYGEEVPRYGFIDVLQGSVRPVDFSYVTELPGIKNTRLVHCCNGLLLFAVKCNWGTSWSYVVCNPAMKQCVAVPSSGLQQKEIFDGSAVINFLSSMGYLFSLSSLASDYYACDYSCCLSPVLVSRCLLILQV